jgi:hypothetical protein
MICRSRLWFCHRLKQPRFVFVACALLATLTWASAQGTMYLDNMNGNPLPAILFMSTKDTSSAYEPSTTFDNQVRKTFRANMSDRINQRNDQTNPNAVSRTIVCSDPYTFMTTPRNESSPPPYPCQAIASAACISPPLTLSLSFTQQVRVLVLDTVMAASISNSAITSDTDVSTLTNADLANA